MGRDASSGVGVGAVRSDPPSRPVPPRRCLLCGGRPEFTGLFVPDLAARPRVLYGLCGRCRARDGWAAHVEHLVGHVR